MGVSLPGGLTRPGSPPPTPPRRAHGIGWLLLERFDGSGVYYQQNPLDSPVYFQSVRSDGYLEIPNKPGWGVELNEEAFVHYPARPWRRPTVYREDGSIAWQ
jgi:hypothetical protein